MSESKTQRSARQARVKSLMLAAVVCASQAVWCPGAFAADDAPEATTQPTTQPFPEPSIIVKGLDEKGTGITLTVNQSRLVTTGVPVRAVDVTQPDIIGAKVISPTEIVLTARKTGSGQLVLWDDQHRSETIDINIEADLKALRAELDRDFPGSHIETSSAAGTIVLRGHVSSADLSDKVVQVATPYGAKVINLMEISGGQQVTLQVKFAEVSKDAISALGVNFAVAGTGGFGANTIGGVEPFGVAASAVVQDTTILGVPSPGSGVTGFMQLTAGKTPFDLFLTAMRQNSLLRVLAEPSLTVMSGSQASFLAGGEFPYPVPQSGGAGGGSTTITIDYKQFGVRLVFTPIVLGNGRIRLHVQPEVSDLDFTHSLTLQGFVIPALTTRTADTTVELSEGQTLAMAGLLNARVNATNTSTPLLGDIPILGALFRSVRYERSETELVVLVTPVLAAPLNPGEVPALPGERWRYPTEPQLYLNGDLGGPIADTSQAPTTHAPRRFHGTYGFVPAGEQGSAAGK